MNRSVIRAMTLLSQMGNYPQGVTATELAQITGLARPTVFRLLLSMAHAGFLEKSDGVFSLGWEVARLGRRADPHRGIIPRVQLVLDRLAAELNETIGYAVVTGPTTFDLVAEADSSHLLSPSQGYIGKDFPLHASATGKIMLANLTDDQVKALLPENLEAITQYTVTERGLLLSELEEVRALGYSTLDNELEEGLFGVSVGVRDNAGQLIGVLAASGLDQRMKSAHVQSFVKPLRIAALKISHNLSGPPLDASVVTGADSAGV
ncbi:IclR family transcriptional regulator [Spiractinospora alimapuensis]|uniref:IclR family transcriptional regulator n=1 Tax=Spiractinospora alimapuensis TaxID=2820884 RepID=UPI0022AAA944|nr:IclR family transcriptional regulator [Spiractinospora alimapuensis]